MVCAKQGCLRHEHGVARETLIESAQRAFDTVKLYRMIYGKRPQVPEDIPFISHVHFHRARNVLDCVAKGGEILGAVPSYVRGSRDLPVTALESGDEWNYRLDRLVSGLQHLGLSITQERIKFLIVANQVTGVFASYLSDQLGWLKHQASISYDDFPEFDFDQTLSAFRPDVVLMLVPDIPPDIALKRNVKYISMLHVGDYWKQSHKYNRLLVCDELHVIGACRAGEQHYHYDCSHILLEIEPHSSHLAVTLPDFSCWPWIRYMFCCNEKSGVEQIHNAV